MSNAPATSKPVKKTTKKPKAPAAHPPVATMVVAAITALKERNGSSLAAIKKYIAGNYKCDVAKLAPFIRKFLKKAVEDGKLKQIRASYKVDKTKVEKPKKKPAKKSAAKPMKVKKTPKKTAKPKKAKTPKKKADQPEKVKTPKRVAKPKKSKMPKKTAAKPMKTKTPKKTTKKPAKK